MPKLDTTIDNLERKTNKVTGTVPSSSWTDAQYPSAKTLYNTYNNLTDMINLVHPIGSIITTSTNTNPANTLGGSWELVDKSLKNTSIVLDSTYWVKPANSELKSELVTGSVINMTDHTISVRLSVKSNVALSDTEVSLGKLVVPSCGVTALMHALIYDATTSDAANCTICYRMERDGTVYVSDVFGVSGTQTAPAGTSFNIHTIQPVYHTQMLDEFCDKFHWKRTA